jgi:hypothetical protein
VGANLLVNDDGGSSYQLYPSIAMDGSGNFVITWEDERNGNSDIYAQFYKMVRKQAIILSSVMTTMLVLTNIGRHVFFRTTDW